ncbi:MAG: methylmalonyl Co-A mutase-associated GTPase MeaB, partial [Acidimicrobiales bacterium]
DLERMLDMSPAPGWRPPVLCTTATTGAGVGEVWQAVVDHRDQLAASGALGERRRRRALEEVTRLVAARLLDRARAATSGPRASELAAAVARGDVDPWTAAEELLDE